jgi:hypothetical protein
MANKYEGNIVDGTEAEEILNPLDEAVNEKAYTNQNVSSSFEDLAKPIEEPRFTTPPLKKGNIPSNDTSAQAKREPINPEMKSLPKKDTEMAASQAATLILNGYEWLHELGNKGLQVSERKLTKLQQEGEINLNAMIDYDYGKKIRAGEFFQEYNQQVSGLLKVSDEFKEEVRPPLERVLAKRGVGLTDEQMLMYMFGKDLAVKGFMFMQQKGQLNYMIQSIKEATMSAQSYQEPQPQPQPQQRKPQQAQPQPQQRQQYDSTAYGEPNEEDYMPIEPEEKSYEVVKTNENEQSEVKKRRGRPKKSI